MTVAEALARIVAAGWGGFSLWHHGEMVCGCLRDPVSLEEDNTTNLWEWQDSAEEAITRLVAMAERHSQL